MGNILATNRPVSCYCHQQHRISEYVDMPCHIFFLQKEMLPYV